MTLHSIRRSLPAPASSARRAILPLLLALSLPAGLQGQASTTYQLLGDLETTEPAPGGVLLRAEHGSVLVQSIAGVGARVRVRFGDVPASGFPEIRSLATGDTAPALGTASSREIGDTLQLALAEGVTVRITRHPLRLSVRDAAGRDLLVESFGAATFNGRVVHYVKDAPGARYYGLGEQPQGLGRNGGVFPFWNTDRFNYDIGQTPIYSTFPFYIAVRNGAAHGILYDNPFRGEMDFANRLPGSIGYTADGGIQGGELRWYVIPGPGLDSVGARYTRLTGRLPLPPRWALGYQQSRYSYWPDTQVVNVARGLRERGIPADAIYLDIHHMDEYRVFTWSPTAFPQPQRMIDTLAAMGFKVVTIVDPGIKKDPAFRVYQEALARQAYVTLPDGSPALGKVWPDTSIYPDFSQRDVRRWWGDLQRGLTGVGVRGIWNDMNEPASFLGGTLSELAQFDGDGHPGTHLEYHNQYGTLMARASYEGMRRLLGDRRPLIITRASYPGVQRYSSVWTGDNQSTWAHLRVSIPMVLSLGLSGEPFAGSDIGGFTGAPSADLYTRWLQSAALIPFMRTHSALDTPRREPWSYGAAHESANRATIRLRYRMLPSLYTAFHQHLLSGAPVVRPVFWGELADSAALEVNDEYMLGDHLLVAPVVDSTDTRSVYLPRGRWFRLGSDSAYTGAQRVTVSAPMPVRAMTDTSGFQALPVFARAGSVIATQAVEPYVGSRPLDTLTLHVFPGEREPVTSMIYEDAGDGYAYQRGQYRETRVTTARGGVVPAWEISFARSGTYPGVRTFVVMLHATDRPKAVRVDGRAVPVQVDGATRTARIVVPSRVSRIVVTP